MATPARTATLLKGLGALAALLAAVVGVPLLLEAVAGSPIPTAIPAWDGVWASLTARDDGTLLLGILKYAAWVGWALFVLSVLADVVTRLRGLPAPRLGPQQQLATQLVGAVLALAVSLPTALPATAAPENRPASAGQPALVALVESGGNQTTAPEQAVDSGEEKEFDEYRVRRGDCLWDIAWNELGEPERWPEIYEASRSIRQPGGGRLTDPDLIVTGWVLHIPGEPEESIDRAAKGNPSPASSPPSVVTPFRNALHTPGSAGVARPGHGTASPPVRTALSTPVTANSPTSALEVRWTEALLHDDSTIVTDREWRARLTLGFDGG